MKLIGEFSIEDLPHMTNKIAGRHWAAKAKERVKWGRLVQHECSRLGISGIGLTTATITFTRHSSKEPDFDGLVSGFKAITDSLKGCGVIVDDKPSVIGQSRFIWCYRPTKQGGMVTVKIETTEKETK